MHLLQHLQLRMAGLLEEQGKLDQAQQMLKGVLEEFKGCWGDNHPETAYVIVRLADIELAMLGKRVRCVLSVCWFLLLKGFQTYRCDSDNPVEPAILCDMLPSFIATTLPL
eukprot:1150986-Pelagomonas_calceolata.AAC.6